MKNIKTLKNILALSLSLAISVSANPNFVITTDMHRDRQGQLIHPDLIFMSEAIKAYKKGYNQSAFTYFKKAAAFGNAKSQRYIGLMYINALGVAKDMVKGYAWLKLAAHNQAPRNIELESQVFNLLSEEEMEQSKIEYAIIKEDYGVIASLTRRDRWVTKQKWKMTGSRAGSMVFAPINYDRPHGGGFYNSIQAFVDDYKYGQVTSGEIIPIEKSEEEEK